MSSSSSSSKKIKSSDDELGLAGLSNALWLVKIPKFVSELWVDAKDGDVLGQLSSANVKDTTTNQVVKKLNVAIPGNAEIGDKPMQFTLDEIGSFANNSNDLVAFVHDQSAGKYSIAGRCTKSLVLKPKDNSQYHQLRKKRVMAESNRQESQYMDASTITGRTASAATYIVNPASGSSNTANKRTKQDVDAAAVRSRIFSTFAKEDKILFADVLAASKDIPGISAENLRPILETYASFHKKGQFHSFWELKPEFRSHAPATAT